MSFKKYALWAALMLGFFSKTQAQTTAKSALQASNILNPNISVIGWFQGEAGHRQSGEEASSAFQFQEAEIALQSIVDPYARADFFVAVEPPEGKVDLEEGYLTWFNLPYGLALKAGKFKANFGKFNRVHRPETAFADRPLAHEAYFGEEGLASVGGSLSWHVPNPWLFVDLDAEVLTMPEADETPAFDTARKKDLLYLGRLSGYYDLTESANITLGGSYAHGSAGREFDQVNNSSSTLKSRLHGLDLTLRWKNPKRAIYKSVLWQTEVLWNQRELSSLSSITSAGLFFHLEYQFARRWRAGGRYDWTESPQDNSRHDQGGLLYLTFTPSEFSLISLQGKQVKRADGKKENLGFLKITFNIGPHGTHPF
ncbi:MAG: hypothetical protein HY402_04975 [Elusimicrobia bacterium]|nr:hypothetical protein [Elusimicrobiota bacterium]